MKVCTDNIRCAVPETAVHVSVYDLSESVADVWQGNVAKCEDGAGAFEGEGSVAVSDYKGGGSGVKDVVLDEVGSVKGGGGILKEGRRTR